MPRSRDAARGPIALLLLLAVTLFTGGCQLIVEDPHGAGGDDSQQNAMSTAVADLPDYDVSVSAIDFDPPLKQETLVSSQQGVKLLAAVENRGTMALTKLIIDNITAN